MKKSKINNFQFCSWALLMPALVYVGAFLESKVAEVAFIILSFFWVILGVTLFVCLLTTNKLIDKGVLAVKLDKSDLNGSYAFHHTVTSLCSITTVYLCFLAEWKFMLALTLFRIGLYWSNRTLSSDFRTKTHEVQDI